MHRYDARQTFVELLEGYIAGIETDERLSGSAHWSARTTTL